MGQCDGRATVDPAPLVAIHHPRELRVWALAAAVSAADFRVALLPPPEQDLALWRDGGFDALAVDPFGGPSPPADIVLLARGIAARANCAST